jgi:hypothetical protein
MNMNSIKTILNKLWLDKVNVADIREANTLWLIYLTCIFMPLLAPVCIEFDFEKERNFIDNTDALEKGKQSEIESKDIMKLKSQNFFISKIQKFTNSFESLEFIRSNSSINNQRIKSLDANQISFSKQGIYNYFRCLFAFLHIPFVKFFFNFISFFCFILLFSYVLLCDFHPVDYQAGSKSLTKYGLHVSIFEIILIYWVWNFLIDAIVKVFTFDAQEKGKGAYRRLVIYLSLSNWNKVTIMGILVFFIGISLRFIPNTSCFTAATVILCFDLGIWLYKVLHFYTFLKSVGPKILMIKEMVIQLVHFLLIVLLVMFGFGIITQALMYPNAELNANLLKNIFFPAYFVTGGEYYTRSNIMNGMLELYFIKTPYCDFLITG